MISRVEKMYFDTYQTALKVAEGKHSEAGYIMDCGYFEFYERLLHTINYNNDRNNNLQGG